MKILKKLWCRWFGHRFRYLRSVGDEVTEYRCKRCGVTWAKGFGKAVRVDKDIRELHDRIVMEDYFG